MDENAPRWFASGRGDAIDCPVSLDLLVVKLVQYYSDSWPYIIEQLEGLHYIIAQL